MANRIIFEVLGNIEDFEKNFSKISSISKKVADSAGKAFLGLGAALALSINEAKNAQKVFNQTEAVIKSTGGVAGITAIQAAELAKSFQKITAFGDEAILSVENMLFTFKEISGDTFPAATKAVLDVSVAMNQGLKESAIQVGKALNDPVLGLTALRRVGIQFTKDQENQIKVLVDTNQTAKAQAVILKELESQFGGSAEAARKGLGSIDALRNSLGDMGEAIGTVLSPAIEKLTQEFTKLVDFISENKALVTAIALFIGIGTAIAGIIFLVAGLTAAIATIGGAVAAAIAAVTTFVGVATFGFFSLNKEAKQTANIVSGDEGMFTKGSLAADAFVVAIDAVKNKMAELKNETFLLGTSILGAFGSQGVDLGSISVVGGGTPEPPAFLTGFSAGLENIREKIGDVSQAGKQFAETLQSGFSNAISSMILGTASAKEAFMAFGQTMLKYLVDFIAQWISFQIISKIGMAAAEVAGIALASTLAAAWAPAAALASLASFGGNAAPAQAGIISTVSLAQFAAIPKLATGSSGFKDDTLGLFNKGEIVIPNSFSEGLRSGELSLSGGGNQGGGIIFNFDGATFVGVTERIVEEIFSKASEKIMNRTLTPLPA